jgi:hypothetical protein
MSGAGRGWTGVAVAGIVLGAAALRFWALGQGMPLVNARPDENVVLIHTVGFPTGDLNPHWFIYPPFYEYLVWGWIECARAIERLRGVPLPSYADLVRTPLPAAIVLGRAFSAVVGTATVAVLYAVGRRLGGRMLGLVAATLLATMFLHVRDSHGLKPDVPLALAMLFATGTLARYVERPTWRRAAAAGVAIGIAASVKYNALVLVVPAAVAAAMAVARARRSRAPAAADFAGMVVVVGATVLALNPHLALDFEHVRATALVGSFAVYATRPFALPPPEASRLETALLFVQSRAFGYHLAVSLRHGCGLAFALATPLALALAWRRPREPFLTLAATACVVYYLVIGASPVHLVRYFTPITPLLALLVASLVVTCAARATRPAGRAAIATAATLVLVASPLASSIAYNRIAARTDTRILATRWMAKHLPRDAVVVILGSGPFPIADPDLPPTARRVMLPVGSTDLARYGVTNVVTHWHQTLTVFSGPDPAWLDAILPQLRLLVEFSPYADGPTGGFEVEDAYYVPFFDFAGVVRPGPVVRIYARTS